MEPHLQTILQLSNISWFAGGYITDYASLCVWYWLCACGRQGGVSLIWIFGSIMMQFWGCTIHKITVCPQSLIYKILMHVALWFYRSADKEKAHLSYTRLDSRGRDAMALVLSGFFYRWCQQVIFSCGSCCLTTFKWQTNVDKPVLGTQVGVCECTPMGLQTC